MTLLYYTRNFNQGKHDMTEQMLAERIQEILEDLWC